MRIVLIVIPMATSSATTATALGVWLLRVRIARLIVGAMMIEANYRSARFHFDGRLRDIGFVLA